MKESIIPMDVAEETRKALEEIEQSFVVRTGIRAGLASPAPAAYEHANGRAPFQPQVIALYGVVIGPV